MKRILIILASLIVLIGIVVGAYFLLSSNQGGGLTINNPFDGLGGSATDVTVNSEGLEPGELLQGAGTEVAPRFFKITQGPVVPQAVSFGIKIPIEEAVSENTGSTTPEVVYRDDTEIRYIERASGNVYSFVLHDRTLTRLGNRTLPGIQRAAWVADGTRAFVQYLNTDTAIDTVETYSLPANGDGGYFLEEGLDQIDVLGSTLVTLLSNASGSVATTAEIDGSAPRTLFSTPLSSIQLHLSSGSYVAATKASSALDGYAFLVSPTSGAFTRILGPLRGLSVLPSPTGTKILYSYVSQGAVRMSLFDTATRSSIVLPLSTLSEKCAWSSDEAFIYCAIPSSFTGTLPDDWYQGAVSTSDRLWRIDLTARLATLLIDPAEAAEVSIDAVGVTVDANSDSVTFTNRKDGSLWVYDL
ncbi:hypothetical protein KKH15_00010 [Patescibacteria group bacterium]|nr:hypothetical protein [Patescibacteria group bacterium]MBU1754763.1 hypothetical protein [Patescibacteria group bacterium]